VRPLLLLTFAAGMVVGGGLVALRLAGGVGAEDPQPDLAVPKARTRAEPRSQPLAADPSARIALEAALRASFDDALQSLAAVRRAEGAALCNVITAQLDEISGLLEKARATAAVGPEAIRARLSAQIAELSGVAGVSEDRLAQEVALLAVKADVREELDRTASHIDAARELLSAGGPVGRQLDFLTQEFNREANTLCSKAPDMELKRIGLDLKAVIDRMREQVQNIE